MNRTPAFPVRFNGPEPAVQNDILIIEHEVVARTRLKAILQGLGYTPRVFENSCDAWNAFEEQPASIVICDAQTPGLDGVSFCKRVRTRPNADYTFFILVTTAFPTADDCANAVAAEVDDFLVKPLRRDAIWRRLHVARRVLQLAGRIQQLEGVTPSGSHNERIREDEQQKPDTGWLQADGYVVDFSPETCTLTVSHK